MNLRATFEHRSGRVIAVLRVVLAFVFLVALAFEPVAAGESVHDGLVLISSYLLFSLVLVAIAWRSWWLDHRLARPVLVADVAIFLGAVFVTEAYDADFTSPFLALFALAVLSSTLRWGSAVAARTGVIVSLLFIALGFVLAGADIPIEVYRFSRRAFYMVALLLVLVWFGIDRRGAQVPPLVLPRESTDPDMLGDAALAYALRLTGATHGALAWSDSEEPWTEVHELRTDGSVAHWRAGPEELGAGGEWNARPCLFDQGSGVALVHVGEGRVRGERLIAPIPLASRVGITEGLALPLACSSREGLIVLGGIEGPGPDFLALGLAIAREIETTTQRLTAARLERESAVIRARSAIARDLHDSVAQSLAGACFRLEALRRNIANGALAAPAEEIAAVRDALRGEQAQVRGLIDTLRDPSGLLAHRPLAADLDRALTEAAAHWHVAASFAIDAPIEAAAGLSHELRQLLREAVANAARHGNASRIDARLGRTGGGLELVVQDDGSGFDEASGKTPPWSIGERVAALGGRLDVVTGSGGTRLSIFLPLSSGPEQTS